MNNKERRAYSLPGIPVFAVLTVAMIALVLVVGWYLVNVFVPGMEGDSPLGPVLGFVVLLAAIALVILLYTGLTPVNPNEARALVLFGRYDGTVRDQGLHWVNPLTERAYIETDRALPLANLTAAVQRAGYRVGLPAVARSGREKETSL